MCKFRYDNSNFTLGNITNHEHKIKDVWNCKTKKGTYYWKGTDEKCKDKPFVEYIGQTKCTFLERYYNHISYARKKISTDVAGKHFNKPWHKLEHMNCLMIEEIRSKYPMTLKIWERYYIF